MKRLFRSVRWRLLLWYALILLGLITGLCLLAFRLTADDRTSQIDREIRNFQGTFFRSLFATQPLPKKDTPPSLDEIRQRLRNPGDASSFPPELHALFEVGSGGTYLACWDNDGSELFLSANAPADLSPPRQTGDGSTRYLEIAHRREQHRITPSGMSSIIGRDIAAKRVHDCRQIPALGSRVDLAIRRNVTKRRGDSTAVLAQLDRRRADAP